MISTIFPKLPHPFTSRKHLTIQSSRLRVELAAPTSITRGARWDRTAFITQVTLDGQHTFCGTEGGGSHGQGLCGEVGLTDPIGFDEAQPGDWFPKLGVGLLRRPDAKEYGFWVDYEKQLFPIEVGTTETSVHFEVSPLPCNGYSARLTKSVRVQENRVSVEYHLSNLGEKPLSTSEYNHNFLCLDGHKPGVGYTLTTNQPWHQAEINTPADKDTISIREGEITWLKAPRKQFHAVLASPEIPAEHVCGWWELRHQEAGIGVRSSDSFAPSRLALFFNARAICPEVFVPIELAPGEEQRWTREWTFLGAGEIAPGGAR